MVKISIEDRGDVRHVLAEGMHPRIGGWHETSELDTHYSVELLRLIHEIKGDWMLEECDRVNFILSFAKVMFDRYNAEITDKRVLDFGCGSASSSIALMRLGAESVVGVDINKDLLRLAELRCLEEGFHDQIHLQQIDFNDPLDFVPDASVDIVMSQEVFEHIFPQDRKQNLLNLWRKLKPGGLLFITGPNRLIPLETHTTGLPFASWLPPRIATMYASTFSKRCKGMNTEELLGEGVRNLTYFEFRRYLAGTGALDMARLISRQDNLAYQNRQGWKRMVELGIWALYRVALSHFGPWEAYEMNVRICFKKPEESPVPVSIA